MCPNRRGSDWQARMGLAAVMTHSPLSIAASDHKHVVTTSRCSNSGSHIITAPKQNGMVIECTKLGTGGIGGAPEASER
jgi:hypothetical protein